MATVKVSKQTYEKLNEAAGKLRARLRRPVSVDEVLDAALKSRKAKPSDFAGTLLITDDEAREIVKDLNEFWSKWKSPRESS